MTAQSLAQKLIARAAGQASVRFGGFTTFVRSEDHPTVPTFIDFWGFGTANTVSFSGAEVAADGSMGFLASNMAPNDLGSLEAIFRISTPGTATTMVKTLAESGLAAYEPYSGVRLSRRAASGSC